MLRKIVILTVLGGFLVSHSTEAQDVRTDSVAVVSDLSGLEPASVKIPCDILLFFLSYQIQKNRIFRRHGKDGKGNGL